MMIEISDDDFDSYIRKCSDFRGVDVDVYELELYCRKDTEQVVAYRDTDGKCYSKTLYWKV